MSSQNKAIKALENALVSPAPIPVNEKKPTTGSGKATFKTASQAASAARKYRDEARESAATTDEHVKACSELLNRCTKQVQEINAIIERGLVSDALVIAAMDKNMRRTFWIVCVFVATLFINALIVFCY